MQESKKQKEKNTKNFTTAFTTTAFTTTKVPKKAAGVALSSLLLPLGLSVPALASSERNEIAYFSSNENTSSIVLRDLEGRTSKNILTESDDVFYTEPELSPNGENIVVSSSRISDGQAGLQIVNRNGTSLRRLTTPPVGSNSSGVFDTDAHFSPDGQTILFTRLTTNFDSDGSLTTSSGELFQVPFGGGVAVKVPNTGSVFTADYSPSGSEIVYANVGSGIDDFDGPLFVIDKNGNNKRSLGVTGHAPAWSPDGNLIAYAVTTNLDNDRNRARDTQQIALVTQDGSQKTALSKTQPTSAPSVADGPQFTPDGKGLVYDYYDYANASKADIWGVDLENIRAGKVFTNNNSNFDSSLQGPKPTDVLPSAASLFKSVTPQRLLDTRTGLGAAQKRVNAKESVKLQVRGVNTQEGAVPSGASAVVLNVTAIGASSSTDVRAYPSGTGVPQASNINVQKGQTAVPNLVTVALGADGAVNLYNNSGTLDLAADIAGYYVPESLAQLGSEAGFTSVAPRRILDTRRDGITQSRGKLETGGVVDLKVTGTVPSAEGGSITVPDNASAVVLNVTAIAGSASTDVRVYPTPTDGAVPTVSNLNLQKNQTVPNLVTVQVGNEGKVRLRNNSGNADVIADIAGYYTPNSGGRFVPVAPTRFLDTRAGIGTAPIPVTAGNFVKLKAAGTRKVPSLASAVVLNLTATGVSAATDVRAYPESVASAPTVSNLNLRPGNTKANLAIVKTGDDGKIRLRNNSGQVDLLADMAGYFTG